MAAVPLIGSLGPASTEESHELRGQRAFGDGWRRVVLDSRLDESLDVVFVAWKDTAFVKDLPEAERKAKDIALLRVGAREHL